MYLRSFCRTLIFCLVWQTEMILSWKETSHLGPLKWCLPVGLTVL